MKNTDCKKPSLGIRQGFTLTELLVVILIIVILAAFSMIGVKRIRMLADKAASVRNLSQLQIANVSFATDHNGKCVSIRANDEDGKTTRWFQDQDYLGNLIGEVLDESGKQLQTVPLHMLDPKVVRARNPLYDRIYTSYGMNDTGLKLGGDPGLDSAHNLNQVSNPAKTMAFATATDFRVTYNSRFKWDFNNPNDSKTAGGEIAYRHGDKVLAVYFDGHIGEISKVDLQEIDQRGGKSNAFWKPKQ